MTGVADKAQQRSDKVGFTEKIKDEFVQGTIKNKTIKQIFAYFGAKKSFEKDAVRASLNALEKEGFLFRDGDRYTLFSEANLIKGVIRGHEKGFAFFTPLRDETSSGAEPGDLFIPPHALSGAHDGDEVYARKVVSDRGSSDEGEVVFISKRLTKLVGTYQAERTYGFVIPDRKGYGDDIFVTFKNAHGAATGDKVTVKILSFPVGKSPEGEVTEILGKKYDLDALEKAIIEENNIPSEFPEAVTAFVRKHIGETVSFQDAENREDFRGEQIITIDGESAKDLDDAISLKVLGSGNFLLGVHIADVSHYVPEGSVLDKEALKRGTSVYFPNFVIPMLPKELSNGICSLNEGVDRLTLSCIMEIDGRGEVVDRRITRGVIKSSHRMTYDAVDAILEGDEELVKQYSDILPLIENMSRLAKILIKKRDERGSVDLDVKDADIYMNARGEIVITPLNRTLSHRIIEEFMIIANETAAEYARFTEIPFLFRVHDSPSGEKLEEFKTFLKNLGINVKWSKSGAYSGDFASILEKLKDSPLYSIVNRVMLRSMSKAKYSPENIGHFGLASECYCHFTSPIRRYPDIIVHRALTYLADGRIGEWIDKYSPIIAEIGRITSECERRADEAERAADDIFKGRYMKQFIGEETEGIVSGVTGFGVFVELENTVEGLIKLDTLPAGNYDFDKTNHTLSSKKLSFKLGERVFVRVAGVESMTGKIQFLFIGKP